MLACRINCLERFTTNMVDVAYVQDKTRTKLAIWVITLWTYLFQKCLKVTGILYVYMRVLLKVVFHSFDWTTILHSSGNGEGWRKADL